MAEDTATIRQLRTDFREVKRKIEKHGKVVITDHGEPAYVIQPLAVPHKSGRPLPDYYKRLKRRQPQPLSADETQQFWEEERA